MESARIGYRNHEGLFVPVALVIRDSDGVCARLRNDIASLQLPEMFGFMCDQLDELVLAEVGKHLPEAKALPLVDFVSTFVLEPYGSLMCIEDGPLMRKHFDSDDEYFSALLQPVDKSIWIPIRI